VWHHGERVEQFATQKITDRKLGLRAQNPRNGEDLGFRRFRLHFAV
jgi:hypothetical protein